MMWPDCWHADERAMTVMSLPWYFNVYVFSTIYCGGLCKHNLYNKVNKKVRVC